MGRKTIKGAVKKNRIPGIGPEGYRPVWDTGSASYHNRIKKVTGINRPST
ncbi:MAG: hypothetical protein ACOY31_00365 [Bacillota bacterium]